MLGTFEIVGRLGAGGMGQVFLGRSPAGRLVAVKTVRPEYAAGAGFRALFAREIDAARRVSGAFTAPVIAGDPYAPVPWLATAYVPGPSLQQLVDACGPLPVETVHWLAAGVAEALESIHSAGIIHRDLKPSNILLAEDGPRVIDFGLVHVMYAGPTGESGAIGTPGFMSPEQAAGSTRLTPASDVYALGATIVFAATGRQPAPVVATGPALGPGAAGPGPAAPPRPPLPPGPPRPAGPPMPAGTLAGHPGVPGGHAGVPGMPGALPPQAAPARPAPPPPPPHPPRVGGEAPPPAAMTDLPDLPDLMGLHPALLELVAGCLRLDPAARPTPAVLIRRLSATVSQAPHHGTAAWLPEAARAHLARFQQIELPGSAAAPAAPGTPPGTLPAAGLRAAVGRSRHHPPAPSRPPAPPVPSSRGQMHDTLELYGPPRNDIERMVLERYEAACGIARSGRHLEAARVFHLIYKESRGLLGPLHVYTIHARLGNTHWLGRAGWTAFAREQSANLAAECARGLGERHHATLLARGEHALWTGSTGDSETAARLMYSLIGDYAAIAGPYAPATLAARAEYASWAGKAGHPDVAVREYGTLVADCHAAYGADAEATLTARRGLAWWTGMAGDPAGARDLYRYLARDLSRLVGKHHPDVAEARGLQNYWSGMRG